MSAALNSKIDKRSCSVSADSRGSELIPGEESGVPVTKTSCDFRSMFGSNAVESVASAVGLSWRNMLWIYGQSIYMSNLLDAV